MFKRPVAIGISPNIDFADFLQALKIIIQPWTWFNSAALIKVQNWFKEYFNTKEVFFFNSGRSALYVFLKSLDLTYGDEVMLQAFTCNVVSNAIRFVGLKPVYVDIDKSLNLDVIDAEKKFTPKTKVVIVQHTFGIAANMDKITEFCKKNNLILIEDCAHSLGATYKNRLVGTFGDAAFFSFGRDKIVSSIFGGALIVKNTETGKKITQYYNELFFPSKIWIWQQLMHVIITYLALLSYNFFGLGKVMLFVSLKLHLITLPVSKSELRGQFNKNYIRQYPSALALLLIPQLQKLEQFNKKRKQNANYYFKNLNAKKFILPVKTSQAVYLRFNILTKKAQILRYLAKQKGMLLGNWYHHIIDPRGVDLEVVDYISGSCPKAEKAALLSVNLPTYPYLTNKQVKQVTELLIYDS